MKWKAMNNIKEKKEKKVKKRKPTTKIKEKQ